MEGCVYIHEIAGMLIQNRKRYRWDRIGMVLGCFALVSVALASWVAPKDMKTGSEQVLAHPEQIMEKVPALDPRPIVKIQASPALVEEEVKPCSCNRHVLKLAKNPYTQHQKAARNLPHSFFVKDKSELQAGMRNGKLVEVKDGRGYHISALSHSHAVLLPEVKELLQDMANDFADLLAGTPSEGTKFRVTSLTRTAWQQSRLGRKNYNAIDEASTHSYGASFDIAFTDRPDNSSGCSAPTRAMQKVLSEYQNQKRILVIPEKDCMHVTLRP